MGCTGGGYQSGKPRLGRVFFTQILSEVVSDSFLKRYLFSTTWLGSFSGSFSVHFFNRIMFSTTSPLCFSVRSG
jgi:hypothetical protein